MLIPQLFPMAMGFSSRSSRSGPPAYSADDIELNAPYAGPSLSGPSHYCPSCKNGIAIVHSSTRPPLRPEAASSSGLPAPTPTADPTDDGRVSSSVKWSSYLLPNLLPMVLFLHNLALLISSKYDSPVYIGWVFWTPRVNFYTTIILGLFNAVYLILGRPRSKSRPLSTGGHQTGLAYAMDSRAAVLVIFSILVGAGAFIAACVFWGGAWAWPLQSEKGDWVVVWVGRANETAGRLNVTGYSLDGIWEAKGIWVAWGDEKLEVAGKWAAANATGAVLNQTRPTMR